MAYSKHIMDLAFGELGQRRSKAREEQQYRRQKIRNKEAV